MKKVLTLLILLVAFSSCETDVKFNNPGFEVTKDNRAWRADVMSASLQGDDIVIAAYRGAEGVFLTFPKPVGASKLSPITYTFAYEGEDNDDISASYIYEDSGVTLDYYAGPDSDVENQGNITIQITEFDGEQLKLSGTFRFNAKYQGDSEIVPENVNFQSGFFYKVPLN